MLATCRIEETFTPNCYTYSLLQAWKTIVLLLQNAQLTHTIFSFQSINYQLQFLSITKYDLTSKTNKTIKEKGNIKHDSPKLTEIQRNNNKSTTNQHTA